MPLAQPNVINNITAAWAIARKFFYTLWGAGAHFGCLRGALGLFWDPLGSSWASLGCPWLPWNALGLVWGAFGLPGGAAGSFLGALECR